MGPCLFIGLLAGPLVSHGSNLLDAMVIAGCHGQGSRRRDRKRGKRPSYTTAQAYDLSIFPVFYQIYAIYSCQERRGIVGNSEKDRG